MSGKMQDNSDRAVSLGAICGSSSPASCNTRRAISPCVAGSRPRAASTVHSSNSLMCKGCFFSGDGGRPKRPSRTDAQSGRQRRFLFRENETRVMVFSELFRPPRSWAGWRGLLSGTRRTGIWKSRFAVWRSDVENCLEAFRSRGSGRERLTAKNGVAGKWRRKGLKTLNQRREMVWARKPRTHNIWYTAVQLTVRD